MNKRQKKKLYKKKYGHNPPSWRKKKRAADDLREAIDPVLQNAGLIADGISDTIEAISRMFLAAGKVVATTVRILHALERAYDNLDGNNQRPLRAADHGCRQRQRACINGWSKTTEHCNGHAAGEERKSKTAAVCESRSGGR